MNPRGFCALSCLTVLTFAASAQGERGVRFEDLAGWWSADPVHGGESSHLALQFLEKDGKPVAQLSLPAIGGYDIGLGEVAITGNAIDTRGLSFPLTWNAATGTLSGTIPADAAPVYAIPIEFRRGQPLEKPPARDWRAPRPKVRWSVETGGAPIWAGIERDVRTGLLFVGNEAGVVHAIGADGKIRWKFETGKPIRAQPTVLGEHVYVHSDSGYLYKLNVKSGAEAWRARVDQGSEPRIPTNQEKTRWDRYGSSVVSNGKRLFIASRDKNLYALDQETGRELWRVAAADIMTATPALFRDMVVFRDRVLLGSRSYDLIALDGVTGKELWKRYYWFSWIESPPVVRDGVVYTGSSDATNVYAIGLADGTVRWKTAVPGWSWQRPAVNDEMVIAGTAGAGAFPGPRAGSLVALDRATGAIRWIYLDPPSEEIVAAKKGWGFGASPVIAGEVAYAADLNGRVLAIDLG